MTSDEPYTDALRRLVGSRPLVLAGSSVVIHSREGSTLLVRRAVDRRLGLPGGFLEPGESFIECARREVLEEIGLSLDARALEPGPVLCGGDELRYTYPNGDIVDNITAIFQYRLDDAAPDITATDPEIAEVEWHALDKVSTSDCFPPERLIISNAAALLMSRTP